MRIAFDAKRAFFNHRGLGNYSRDVIRLFTTYAPENEYLLFSPKTDRCHFVGTRSIFPQGGWSYFPSLWRTFGCISRMGDVDIYHGLSGELPYRIGKKGIRTVVTLHDVIFIRYPELYSFVYRKLFFLKTLYACKHADTIIAISEQTKRDIIDYLHADERKIIVVYQGCNTIFREEISDEEVKVIRLKYGLPEHYIIDVGAIEPRKNLKNLIRAVSLSKTDIPVIAVGGRSHYAEEVRCFADKLGVRLMMLHNVPFVDLPKLYKGAEVMVYPSLFEGFGIPILEAMTVGIPVLTSTGSCFLETGGDAAIYANPLEPEDISTQLVRILTDAVLRQKMIKSGFQQAEKFTDAQVAKNLFAAVLNE